MIRLTLLLLGILATAADAQVSVSVGVGGLGWRPTQVMSSPRTVTYYRYYQPRTVHSYGSTGGTPYGSAGGWRSNSVYVAPSGCGCPDCTCGPDCQCGQSRQAAPQAPPPPEPSVAERHPLAPLPNISVAIGL